jgi:hypothetical protein
VPSWLADGKQSTPTANCPSKRYGSSHIVFGTQKFMRKSRGHFVFWQSASRRRTEAVLWRAPRRFANIRNHRVARSILDCHMPQLIVPFIGKKWHKI